MKTAPKTMAFVLTGILAAASLSPAVHAAAGEADKAPSVLVTEAIKIPGHAKSVLAESRAARVAIFEGQTDAAVHLVQKALDTFGANIADYAIALDDDAGFGIPVDSSVEFAEDFEPTAESAKVISEAGKLAQQGDNQTAVKTMVEAGIGLDFKFAMLPVTATVESLNNALSELQNGGFYEANIALKAIENSVIIEDFGAAENPQQGYAWETINKS